MKKLYSILNVALFFISIILLLNFFNVKLPNLGNAIDKSEPLCITSWKNDFIVMQDLNRCCLESRQQLECVKNKLKLGTDWTCSTGDSIAYHLNNKAYEYCRGTPWQ